MHLQIHRSHRVDASHTSKTGEGNPSGQSSRRDQNSSFKREDPVPETLAKRLTRRDFLWNALQLGSGVAFCGLELMACQKRNENPSLKSFVGAKFLGAVDFIGEGRMQMNTPLLTELDGRLFFDHSRLTGNDSVTAMDKFYIRTRASALLDLAKPWSLKLGGTKGAQQISAKALLDRSEPQGVHLMECAGNGRSGHFGLMGVAAWDGVLISSLLAQSNVTSSKTQILISGFDTYVSPSRTSIPGASWVFSIQDLTQSGAFLATQMNGSALTPDHGAPVRLVVPGWYGCCCIKWVEELTIVGADAKSTSQMQEYSARTHQDGVPAFARAYEPAIIDPAAMPIRVEKWACAGLVRYKVIGIHWGGTRTVNRLDISFDGGNSWRPVEVVDERPADSWGFWAQGWSPTTPGTYRIRLKLSNRENRTRRLDMGFYDRAVQID
jgi:DMSO/TMAO reductase YedYZ molybdopterin-dependent catalytic subunit